MQNDWTSRAGSAEEAIGLVVAEYGAVNLHGASIRERGEMLIGIAHPDFRAELRRDLANIRHV